MRLFFAFLSLFVCTVYGAHALSLRNAHLSCDVESAFTVIGRQDTFKITRPKHREQADARLAQRLAKQQRERPIFTRTGAVNPVHLTRASDLHELGYKGKGTKLAIIESGFSDRMLEQLQRGGLLLGRSHSGLHGQNDDFTLHGDQVLELAHTMAPKAKILPLSDNQLGRDTQSYITAIQLAMDAGVDAISISYFSYSSCPRQTQQLIDKIAEAHSQGIMFFVSSGNNSDQNYIAHFTERDRQGNPSMAGQILTCAAAQPNQDIGLFVVGASYHTPEYPDTPFIAKFTSMPPKGDTIVPFICAPGANIQLEFGDPVDGTSFASPTMASLYLLALEYRNRHYPNVRYFNRVLWLSHFKSSQKQAMPGFWDHDLFKRRCKEFWPGYADLHGALNHIDDLCLRMMGQ